MTTGQAQKAAGPEREIVMKGGYYTPSGPVMSVDMPKSWSSSSSARICERPPLRLRRPKGHGAIAMQSRVCLIRVTIWRAMRRSARLGKRSRIQCVPPAIWTQPQDGAQ